MDSEMLPIPVDLAAEADEAPESLRRAIAVAAGAHHGMCVVLRSWKPEERMESVSVCPVRTGILARYQIAPHQFHYRSKIGKIVYPHY